MTQPTETHSQWIAPEVASSLGNLELLATQVVEGFITGLHTSPYHGYNQEFSEHRPYQMGDEIRYLDWKLYGRTDRFFVKQFEADTNLRATLVIDASGSMDFCGQDQPHPVGNVPQSHRGLTKYEYAQRLAACLSYLLLRQRDATGIALIQQGLQDYIPARAVRYHLRNLMESMAATRPEGPTQLASGLTELASRLARRGMIIVISDLLEDHDKVMEALKQLHHRKHEVIVFHLLDPQELAFSYDCPGVQFEDPETGQHLDANPRQLKNEYLAQIREFVEKYRQTCLEHHICYELVRTDRPLQEMLPRFLVSRRHRKK